MGWILGPYEKGAPARFADGVPDWFGRSLFPGDLDRLVPHIEAAHAARAGARELRHQGHRQRPDLLHADGSPLIGPAWGVRNVWLNEGHSFGITAAGGAGWQLAEWIVEGEPGIDMLARRPAPLRRLHQQALLGARRTRRPTATSSRPLPGRGARRMRGPAKTSPVYDKLKQHGRRVRASATAGSAPTGSRRTGVARKDNWSFRRTNYFEHVGNEVPAHARARRRHRPHRRSRSRGHGPGRRGLARRPGREQGAEQDRPHGALARADQARRHPLRVHDHEARRPSTSTSSAPAPPSATTATTSHKACPPTARCRCATSRRPRLLRRRRARKSRDVLAKLTDTPLDNEAFPWLTGQTIEVGPRAGRLRAARQFRRRARLGAALPDRVRAPPVRCACSRPARRIGIGMVGMRAMESLRMEKSYRMWGSDMTPRLHAVRGRPRPLRAHEQGRRSSAGRRSSGSSPPGVPNRFVTLEVHGVTDADPLGNEPLFDAHGTMSAGRPPATTAITWGRVWRSATCRRSLPRSAPSCRS